MKKSEYLTSSGSPRSSFGALVLCVFLGIGGVSCESRTSGLQGGETEASSSDELGARLHKLGLGGVVARKRVPASGDWEPKIAQILQMEERIRRRKLIPDSYFRQYEGETFQGKRYIRLVGVCEQLIGGRSVEELRVAYEGTIEGAGCRREIRYWPSEDLLRPSWVE